MKIKNKDLIKLYKVHIMENIPHSRKSCPPSKEIISFFKSKTSEKQKSRIIDHITKCSSCAKEFEFMLQTRREEGKLIEGIDKLLQSEENIAAIKKRGGKKINYLNERRKSFFPRLSWKYAFMLAGVAIIISTFLVFQNIGKREYRGPDYSQVRLIEPINGKYSKSLLVFKWNEFKNSEYYIIELFDEGLYQIWKSSKIYKNQATLPAEIAKRLNINKTHFWMVTAFLPDGRKIESEIEEFSLID
jgi:transposase-like protein